MTTKKSEGFSSEERAAMKDRAKDLQSTRAKINSEEAVLAAIAAMSEADRAIGERLHAVITAAARDLSPKTSYTLTKMTVTGKDAITSVVKRAVRQ